MLNGWSKEAYMKGFYCEYITLQKVVSMFEHIENLESIYEGVIEIAYKSILGYIPTMLVTSGK